MIGTTSLTLEEVVAVARHQAPVALHPEAVPGIISARQAVEDMIASRRVVYGITTGFGKFAEVSISPEESAELQHNLIVSHACGVGPPLPTEVVRAMMLLRAQSLAQGFSGVQPETIALLLEMLQKGVTPVVPSQGSLGSSGDLCPLSHMVLPMLGLGEAYYQGELLEGGAAMQRAELPVIKLQAKEGLALNNGTQCMTALGALATWDALYLLEIADLAAALTLEALEGRVDAFDPRIHRLRQQTGQQYVAAKLLEYTANSGYLSQPPHPRVQDAYALRCIPQVHGASRDALGYVQTAITNELNAVTDNPLIFAATEEAISGGNFHGQPIALALDFLGIALAELANISERRLERLVNPALSNGLPAFLAPTSGLHSGFMIVQYTAAALVSENKVLAHPASVDSIPSSGNQEDHVSMGTIAARKARQILTNTQNVLATELLAACQAIDLRSPASLGAKTAGVYRAIRARVPAMLTDRIIAPDIAAVRELITRRELTNP
ncbi:MAG: histidine ammonia-lyase [Symbiobacteriaceae bacterium]|nr:histidine ammonia-lyase [Symbiobacteriaceae bacterium]